MEMAEGVCCCPTKRVGGSEYRQGFPIMVADCPAVSLDLCIYTAGGGNPLYESFATVGEIRVYWRADFQSGSRVLKKVF